MLREEIIRNLTNDGGEVTVEIIVSATKAEGFSESIARSVRENSAQLGLEFSEGENSGMIQGAKRNAPMWERRASSITRWGGDIRLHYQG